LLAEDDELNLTNEPTLERQTQNFGDKASEPTVSLNIPSFPAEHITSMNLDDDSISTFHPGKVANLVDEEDSDEK